MAVATRSFTTGPATLPDVGEINYNSCSFSPLFATEITGHAIKDEATRTVKYMEYNLSVDGYVTLNDGANDIEPTMTQLRRLLTQQGGALVYRGRGMDLIVNVGGSPVRDVAWGPKPELLEFQPLGAGRSAKVRWQVKVCISETDRQAQQPTKVGQAPIDTFNRILGGNKPTKGGAAQVGGIGNIPLLQFNYETVVSYGEDGFSSLSIRGTLEIAMTRSPDQKSRTVKQTADDARSILDQRIMSGIDLDKFYPIRRDFSLSRDKRILEWNFQFDERSYQQYPPDCTMADGTYSVRPAKTGMGLCLWLCTLHATYTVRNDRPRRTAWLAFLALLRLKMNASNDQPPLPNVKGGNQNPKRVNITAKDDIIGGPDNAETLKVIEDQIKKQGVEGRKAWLIDFNIDEGLYKNSKTTSFSATWRMVCTFSHILLASGVWRKVPERDATGDNLWATHMSNVSGSKSWKRNLADPDLDVIIDFGSP